MKRLFANVISVACFSVGADRSDKGYLQHKLPFVETGIKSRLVRQVLDRWTEEGLIQPI